LIPHPLRSRSAAGRGCAAFARQGGSMTEPFDVIVIGAGQAGVPLAGSLAGMGKRVVLVERKFLGGSCINFGCTPTKAAIASARVAHLARRGSEFGLRIPAVEVDFGAVIRRARA